MRVKGDEATNNKDELNCPSDSCAWAGPAWSPRAAAWQRWRQSREEKAQRAQQGRGAVLQRRQRRAAGRSWTLEVVGAAEQQEPSAAPGPFGSDEPFQWPKEPAEAEAEAEGNSSMSAAQVAEAEAGGTRAQHAQVVQNVQQQKRLPLQQLHRESAPGATDARLRAGQAQRQLEQRRKREAAAEEEDPQHHQHRWSDALPQRLGLPEWQLRAMTPGPVATAQQLRSAAGHCCTEAQRPPQIHHVQLPQPLRRPVPRPYLRPFRRRHAHPASHWTPCRGSRFCLSSPVPTAATAPPARPPRGCRRSFRRT